MLTMFIAKDRLFVPVNNKVIGLFILPINLFGTDVSAKIALILLRTYQFGIENPRAREENTTFQ